MLLSAEQASQDVVQEQRELEAECDSAVARVQLIARPDDTLKSEYYAVTVISAKSAKLSK
jgi:hypothetical protein